jgi:hypothetical protein
MSLKAMDAFKNRIAVLALTVALFLLLTQGFSLAGEKDKTLPAEFAMITDSDLASQYRTLFEKLADMQGETLLYSQYSEEQSEVNRISALLSEQLALGTLDQTAHDSLIKALWDKFNGLKYEGYGW